MHPSQIKPHQERFIRQGTPDAGLVHVQRFRQGFRGIEAAAVKELLPGTVTVTL